MDPTTHNPPELEDDFGKAEEEVLTSLRRTEAYLHELLGSAHRHSELLRASEAQLSRSQARIIGLEERCQSLAVRLQEAHSETEQKRALAQAERHKADAERARSQRLETVLSQLHQTFFTGNVYALILKACLTITGATRGLYVTTEGTEAPLKIRAALGVAAAPGSPPSAFLEAACRHVLQSQETLVANSREVLAKFPSVESAAEQFRNCIVTPGSLLQNVNGVVIAADKTNGDFDDEDVRSVLAVGSQAGVATENSRLRRQLQQAYLATVSVMADAMEAKDSYTQGHSEAVSRYARLIGRHLNLSDLERSVVSYAALLHDIGKIGVSDGLLNKPGPLTPEERELVRAHVRLGHDLIRHIPALQPVAEAVLHHHECYDGTGYPDGLAGDAIPIAARIVCVVDAYSAIITRRSYKEAYSEDWARAELRRCAGIQFDPRIVDAFLYVLDLPDLSEMDEDGEFEWLPVFHLASDGGGENALLTS